MDRKIKTRQVHKDIKVLDKTVTVTDHIKQSYVRTKESNGGQGATSGIKKQVV